MIPHEKALVERMKDKPFALIGINSDGPAEKVREILKENGITWRNAVDGGPEGPLATRWKVDSWPSIFVLDSKGLIRYRDVRERELDEAVKVLLRETEKK